jgi:hypothetical protein
VSIFDRSSRKPDQGTQQRSARFCRRLLSDCCPE